MKKGIVRDSDIEEYLEKCQNDNETVRKLTLDSGVSEEIVFNRLRLFKKVRGLELDDVETTD